MAQSQRSRHIHRSRTEWFRLLSEFEASDTTQRSFCAALGPGSAFADMSVNMSHQPQSLGQVIQGRYRAKVVTTAVSGWPAATGEVNATTMSSALSRYFCQTILGLPSMRLHARA